MTLQAHLPHDLDEYQVTKRPAKVFKVGERWHWEHACLHRPASTPVTGYPHITREEAQRWALEHWRRC